MSTLDASDTIRFPPADGVADDIESWRELIWGDLPPFHSVTMGERDASFSGRIARTILGPVSTHLVEVRGRDHTAVRTADHMAATAEPAYVVIHQLAGTSEVRLDRAVTRLGPGDLAVWRSASDYRWRFPNDAAVFMVIVPQDLLGVPPRSIGSVLGTTIRPETRYGRGVAELLHATALDPSLREDRFAARHVRDVIDLVTTRLLREAAAREPHDDGMLGRVVQFIETRLGDPDLSIDLIARSHFVSVRYLQQLFHDNGTTVSTWVRHRRLQRARADLADPASADSTIAVIAAQWGFLDHSYFSRAFRRRFGVSPHEYRRRSGAVQATDPSP